MRPQEIIAKKRDGRELTTDDIDTFIEGVTNGSWADYQTSALLMAMFVRGLSAKERDGITFAMLHSGEVLDFEDVELPKSDKHSTGGVGDKTSLIVAPLAAACGVAVPMISGRGLGHTGGTLDKLESISGYRVGLSINEFRLVIKECGFAMAGQSAQIVPADKKLYALRDATATVPYIPLIVASIMSKKLAEGLDALVLDVKTGSGAFMPDPSDSRELAKALVETGKSFGVRTEAVISDMSQPLGRFVGNSHEVYECVKILRGETPEGCGDTLELSFELAARMLVLAGVAGNRAIARQLCERKIGSGEALEAFRRNVEMQGGDANICDEPEMLVEKGLETFEVKAGRKGSIAAIDTRAIGEAVVSLGGGRTRAEDSIDHCVGFECTAKIGDEVAAGELLGRVFCRDVAAFDGIEKMLNSAFEISEEKPAEFRLIHETVT